MNPDKVLNESRSAEDMGSLSANGSGDLDLEVADLLGGPCEVTGHEVRRLQTWPRVGIAGKQVTCLQPLATDDGDLVGKQPFPVGVKSSPISCTGPKRYGVWGAP